MMIQIKRKIYNGIFIKKKITKDRKTGKILFREDLPNKYADIRMGRT